MAGALAAAALLAGCGGSGAEQAAFKPIATLRTSSLSRAAFLKRATALCEEVREQAGAEYRRYFQRHGLKLSPASFRSEVASHAAGLFDEVVAHTYQREVDGIRALGAPKGDEARVTEILNAIERGIAAGKKGGALGFFYGKSPFRPAYVLAGPYGLGPCATG